MVFSDKDCEKMRSAQSSRVLKKSGFCNRKGILSVTLKKKYLPILTLFTPAKQESYATLFVFQGLGLAALAGGGLGLLASTLTRPKGLMKKCKKMSKYNKIKKQGTTKGRSNYGE